MGIGSNRAVVEVSPQEFTALFRAHHAAVVAYALRRVDAHSAQEVAAQTFATAWRRRAHIPQPPQPPAAVLAWLLAVARRVLANEVRRATRSRHLVERLRRAEPAEPTATAPDHAGALAASAGLRAALEGLRARDREVVQLVAWEGLGPEQLAVVLGCSPGAAKVRLHRARTRLRAALQDQQQNQGLAGNPELRAATRAGRPRAGGRP